ncbi:MAG: VWA domain-containing protein [Acidobacteriota bacterium]|nr:VWA domain-containing protein [Acidobacteriota bacterium]
MGRFWLVVTLALGVAVRAGGQTPRAAGPLREVSPGPAGFVAPTATPPFPRATPTTAPTAVPKPRETPLPTYTESAGSEYVLMPVLVFDPKGRFVDDLLKKDFRIQAGGVKVDLDTFDKDEGAPASFAFLVDTSGSMKLAGKLESAKSAVRHVIENRRAGDDFALFAFAEDEVSLLSDFSPDPTRLLRVLDTLEAGGRTALFDAVAATPTKMMAGRNGKRAVLLFTDGVDNASKLSSLEMAEILQQVSIPVYAVGMKNAAFDRLSDEERKDLALDNLKLLAASSGGQLFLASGEEDLKPIAAKINGEVRKQYLMGFAPSGRGELKYQVVVVSVLKPGKWIVRTRRGYRGTAPAAVP